MSCNDRFGMSQKIRERRHHLWSISVGGLLILGLTSTLSLMGCDGPARHAGRIGSQLIGGDKKGGKQRGKNGDAQTEAEADHAHDLPPGTDPSGDGVDVPLPSLSLAPETIVWKRYRPFEDGLVQGLQLDRAQLCQELGQHSCIEKVHLTVLGGNEPYFSGQYEATRSPTVLTGVAVERIVLAACNQRLGLDIPRGAQATIFKHMPLTGASVTPEQVKAQTSFLYQRLLSRDASTDELSLAVQILGITKTPEKVALALCFVVGTQIENVFL